MSVPLASAASSTGLGAWAGSSDAVGAAPGMGYGAGRPRAATVIVRWRWYTQASRRGRDPLGSMDHYNPARENRNADVLTATDARAVIALLVYNHAPKLQQTLADLEAQTRRDFAVLLLDDGSTDDSPRLCRDIAARDPRFVYLPDDRRLGYIRNARRGLEEARRRFPQAAFFAWASDHDRYHPAWFERHAAALDQTPEATLAWPLCDRIDADGNPVARAVHRFHTHGLTSPLGRFRATLIASLDGRTVVGNMAYGLFRMDAFAGGPGLRFLLVPDRPLILEAALKGPCVQIEEVLWSRRYADIYSLRRQKKASFSTGQPGYLLLPVWVTHVGHFLINWGIRGQGRPQVSRAQGVAAAVLYLLLFPWFWTAHRFRVRGPQWKRAVVFSVVKPTQMAIHRARKTIKARIHRIVRGSKAS